MAQYDLPYSFYHNPPSQHHIQGFIQPSPTQSDFYSQYYPSTSASPSQLDDPLSPTHSSRTVYLGNIPADISPEKLLNHVHSGPIESVKLIPEKKCAFISFLTPTAATHFYSDALLKKLSLNNDQEVKVGWGKSSSISPHIAVAVSQDGASRNVYVGNLPDDITEAEIRSDLGKFGTIDTIKLLKDKNIGFVHFLSISMAMKCVQNLPLEKNWEKRKVFYGKDRSAYISKTQQQNAAQYLGIAPGYEHLIISADRDLISTALAQQSAAAVAVATAAGGAANAGNRTVYLGSVHPETTIEEICNVVRGGLLHQIRYFPEKHICFVTFVDPTAAAQFFAIANLQGLAIHNKRLKIGWGKHSGPLPSAIAMAVTAGASRNVYIGNIDGNWPESKLRQDFSEYGEIEQINFLPEKSCAFVNFTNIANAIQAIEKIKQRDEYKSFKINFGKDRCGNPSRQLQQQLYQHQMQFGGLNGYQPNAMGPSVSSSHSVNGDEDDSGGYHLSTTSTTLTIPEESNATTTLDDEDDSNAQQETETHTSDTNSNTTNATQEPVEKVDDAILDDAPVQQATVEKTIIVENQPITPLDDNIAAATAADAARSFGLR